MQKNTRVRFAMFGVAAALGSLLAPGVARAQGAQIVRFTHAGNGCPAGTVGWVFDEVNNKLTLSFDKFSTKLPPGTSSACNINFVVKVPSNLQISLNRVEYLGYIDTEKDVYGQLRRRYKYGDNAPLAATETFPKGKVGDFYVVDEFTGWSVCTNQVTVATTTRADLFGTPATRVNELVVDTAQYSTEVVFTFDVKQC